MIAVAASLIFGAVDVRAQNRIAPTSRTEVQLSFAPLVKKAAPAVTQAVAEEARRIGARRIALNSDPYAEAFYRRLGAVRIGDHAVAEIPGRVLPRLAFSLDAG